MRAAGECLEKHRVPELPQLLEILALEIHDLCKGEEQVPRSGRIPGAHARRRHEGIIKLLHRVLPGAHEVFEIILRVDRLWGAGHGVP
jgi:hypothetical protein